MKLAAVVAALQEYVAVARVAEEACCRIAGLAEEGNRESAVEAGALEAVQAAMMAHPQVAGVREWGCKALRNTWADGERLGADVEAGQAAGAKAGEQMDLASLLAQGRAKQAAGHRRRFDRQLLHRLLGRVALVEEDLRDHERARIDADVDFAVLSRDGVWAYETRKEVRPEKRSAAA
eukprot:scaffold16530_cov53-Phaeocystis_antarctica.AAC.1